jgi:hypothetical protein
MVAMDDRERVDAALDRGIGRRHLLVERPARVQVEQRGDDLEVVLDPVMDSRTSRVWRTTAASRSASWRATVWVTC